MKKTAILFAVLLLTFNTIVMSQTTQKPDSIQTVEKAKYLKEDLTKFLSKNVAYPNEAIRSNIQGDVVLSFTITKNGKLDSLTILKSPDFSFSTSTIVAFDRLYEQWSPSRINDRPVDKKYFIIIRFRIYINTQPPDNKSKTAVYIKKQKFEKALKLLNNAIKDNQYDFELFESRSQVKEILGDTEGSKQDQIASDNLNNEVMTVVDINAIGITRTVVVKEEIVVMPR